jgi:hypothetical protein
MKKLLFVCIILCIIFIVSAIFLELIVRKYYYVPDSNVLWKFYNKDGNSANYYDIYIPDEEIPLTYGLLRDYFFRIRYPAKKYGERDYFITYQTNNIGFRDARDYFYEKSKGKKRGIVIGDSFSFGWGVNNENNFVKLLDTNIEGYEFLNFSAPGYSLINHYLFFKKDLLKYKPDKVVISFYAENDFDFGYMPQNFEQPLDEKIFDVYVKDFYSSSENFQNEVRKIFNFANPNTYELLFIYKNDSLFITSLKKFLNLIQKKFSPILRSRTFHFVKLLINQGNMQGYNDLYAEYLFSENNPALKPNIKSLIEIKKICDKNNIDLLVVIFPYLFNYSQNSIFENNMNFIRNLLNENKILFIDLSEVKNNLNEVVCHVFDAHPSIEFHYETYKAIKKNMEDNF